MANISTTLVEDKIVLRKCFKNAKGIAFIAIPVVAAKKLTELNQEIQTKAEEIVVKMIMAKDPSEMCEAFSWDLTDDIKAVVSAW